MSRQGEYNRRALLRFIREAIETGKVPYIVVNQNNRLRILQDVRGEFPNYLVVEQLNQLLEGFNEDSHPGFIFDGMANHQWPCVGSIGTFYSLLTGNTMDGLQGTPQYRQITDRPRILMGTEPPEILLDQWIHWGRTMGQPMNLEQTLQFRNLCEQALDVISILYVEVTINTRQLVWFHHWLRGPLPPNLTGN